MFDLAVVGGGINGVGIARDAAGRGLSVVLVEKGDLGCATSSASTKLIHGGLRYLEHKEFRLVREALTEREVLLRAAPHIIKPMRFVLPHHAGLRPAWLIRLGLFIYDHVGGRHLLPGTTSVNLRTDITGKALRPHFTTGFEYSDCWVDDSRLVILNALDASRRGADIRPRTACRSARREGDLWHLRLDTGETIQARALVNATGPWVSQFLDKALHHPTPPIVRLVKGSHIVVPRLFQHDRAYIFQNADGRVCFAIPYERDFTLIGTTDEDYGDRDPGAVTVTSKDESYLLSAVNEYISSPITATNIVHAFAGVRPLYDENPNATAQDASRDYTLKIEGDPPLLNVFGGKLTTYRRLAEAAMADLKPFFPKMSAAWTAKAALPGGEIALDELGRLRDAVLAEYPFMPRPTIDRWIRTYGTITWQFLEPIRSRADLGKPIAADLTEYEVSWLQQNEWARTAEDILWRRTKLGLVFDDRERHALHLIMDRP